MPKLKTNKSAAKRFRVTKNGKFKRSRSFGRHLLTGKSPKRRRSFRHPTMVSESDEKRVRAMLPYA